MIKVNETDYIVGLWMVKRFGLGKVYVYATKCENKDEWTIHKKYMYDNQSYNIYMNDNDYKNNCLYKDKYFSKFMRKTIYDIYGFLF